MNYKDKISMTVCVAVMSLSAMCLLWLAGCKLPVVTQVGELVFSMGDGSAESVQGVGLHLSFRQGGAE